ncbi:MAG: hypothetical protein BGO01_13300 [Armatimonadetes bacterium 55-13]|nr:hypothetical protein [Armatimonadota bacterium]OJU61886.1 MAG: hypothetical protein BGO01_13300 [Armatimonadetes bacterium 55-13]
MKVKLVFILGAIAAAGMVMAQGAGPKTGGRQGGPGGPGMQRRMMSPEDRLKMMSKFLGLTPAQEKKIKPILEDSMKKSKAIREDKKMPEDKKREAMKKLRDANNKKIEAILTPEQKKKMEDMRKRGPGGPGGRGPGGPGGAPPKAGGKGKG